MKSLAPSLISSSFVEGIQKPCVPDPQLDGITWLDANDPCRYSAAAGSSGIDDTIYELCERYDGPLRVPPELLGLPAFVDCRLPLGTGGGTFGMEVLLDKPLDGVGSFEVAGDGSKPIYMDREEF